MVGYKPKWFIENPSNHSFKSLKSIWYCQYGDDRANQLIFGLTQKLGYTLNVIISERNKLATTKAHREDPKQERKAKKDIMNVQKFQMSYVSKCCALF